MRKTINAHTLRVVFFACFFLALIQGTSSANGVFVPIDPILPLSKIVPGMKGEARTVILGTKVTTFPITVIGILPRNEVPRNLIVIRADAPYMTATQGIAQGMSGSPVYVGGKLIGAIGYGWPFTDSRLGMVTPIEEMIQIFNWKDAVLPVKPAEVVSDTPLSRDTMPAPNKVSVDVRVSPDVSADRPLVPELSAETVASLQKARLQPLLPPLIVSGVSDRMANMIGEKLGRSLERAGGGSGANSSKTPFVPGSSIGGALVWGDVTVGSIGTLTTIGKDGRFLAFAHPFLERGATSIPVTESTIVKVVPSQMNAFKIGYLGGIRGLITQDRRAGIGGRLGQFGPSVSAVLRFDDVDAKKISVRRFQMVQDPFLISQLSSVALLGAADDLWGRKGEGTARITTRFTGTALPLKGWQRSNIFFSDKDVMAEMSKELTQLTTLMTLNPFQDVRPLGIEVDIQISSSPRVLLIQKVEIEKRDSYKPGDKVEGTILFRGWRKQPFLKKFSVVIPAKISGLAELVVRAGGVEEGAPDSLSMGWRAIQNLKELLGELDARETNDLVVVEIRGQEPLPERGQKGPLPEDIMDNKLQAQIREERLKEGSMRILRTNYYVHGLIRELIQVGNASEDKGKAARTVSDRKVNEDIEEKAPKAKESETTTLDAYYGGLTNDSKR